MVVFPNCKINIGLQIKDKRQDGFHDLETIFLPLGIKDALEILPAPNSTDAIAYTSSGNSILGQTEDNLCCKAYHILKKDFPLLPNIRMHLHKHIPTGAGLGGGSADAAFTINLLNNLFRLNISSSQLQLYALTLGSDCPFFILNKPVFATGRGEIMQDIQIDLKDFKIMVVNPGIHVNTGWAFSQLSGIVKQHVDLKAAIQQPIQTWKNIITNDFEQPVFAAHPEIAQIKEALYAAGATYAAMSGSGSSVFGIFHTSEIPKVNFPTHYFCTLV